MGEGRQQHLNQALLRIPRRAETSDRSTLSATFVAAGSFAAMLHSVDHQIIYGRRGAGKTHALLYLSDLVEKTGDVAVYVDLRTIGSAGGLYADGTLGQPVRGTHLLVDTLEAIHEALLSLAIDNGIGDAALLSALDALAEAATEIEVVGEVEAETTISGTVESSSRVDLSASPSGPSVTVSAGGQHSSSAQNRLRRTGTERHHVVFGPLGRALRAVTEALAPARLWLLLDEWSSVPIDLQPLLADLVRRSVLPTHGITVKIAAIEHRSRFRERTTEGGRIGIELGADAASAVSLDDFLTFDDGRHRAQDFFARLFFNHAEARLAAMLTDLPPDPATFVREAFRRNAFPELVRAAEGVPRDAINIAALAAQHAHDEPIGIKDVRVAARDWYLRDKQAALRSDEPARRLLKRIVDEVVGRRRARTFLLDQLDGGRHGAFDELYDARLVHVLRRGVVDPKNPGTLYDGFVLDYGCYVSLLLTGEWNAKSRGGVSWLGSPKGVPQEGFDLAKEVLNLAELDR